MRQRISRALAQIVSLLFLAIMPSYVMRQTSGVRRLARIVSLLFLAVMPAIGPRPLPVSAADWTRLGLAGHRVDALAVSPVNGQVIFAGTRGQGVFRSADSGATWTAVNTGLTNRFVNTLLADRANASVVLAGTGESAAKGDSGRGVYKSTDGGINWTRHFEGHVARLLAAPGDGRTIYAAGDPFFSRSTDAGLAWTRNITVPPANADLTSLSIHPLQPQTLLAGGVTEGGSGRVFRSRDGGTTWTTVAEVGLPAIFDVAVPSADGAIALLGSAAGIWRSADGGQNWQRLLGAFGSVAVQRLLVNPRQPSTVFAGSLGQGVLVSNDGGATWSAMPGALATANVRSLAVDDSSPQVLYAGTDDGVWRLPIGEFQVPVAVDARIEIVWPHGGKPVTQATAVNATAYLFQNDTLKPVPCLYDRTVRLWRSLSNAPAEPVATGIRRMASVGGKAFPVWDFNDVAVEKATDPANKYIFRLTVDGVPHRSSVWVHGADPRTIFPHQDVPTSTATAGSAVDARIEIVWPHDAQGREAPVSAATLANLAVDVYNRGTLQSVPADWAGTVRLYRAVNAGVETEVGVGRRMTVTRGSLVYPRWGFDDVDVSAARSPATKLSFRAAADGISTFSNVWIHGVDARTIFPQTDVPVSSCE
ncbi:MAG: hypothetical protein HY331_04090 [Chloroflexi bacterium]|nr:hypothetical protein [Chloroflexota bacterium]